jgi:lipid-A-disaccharide synthase
MNKPVVKELIQSDCTAENLKNELNELLNNERRKEEIRTDYENLKRILREGGNASEKTARSVINFLSGPSAPVLL